MFAAQFFKVCHHTVELHQPILRVKGQLAGRHPHDVAFIRAGRHIIRRDQMHRVAEFAQFVPESFYGSRNAVDAREIYIGYKQDFHSREP